jgi:carbon storage regulator
MLLLTRRVGEVIMIGDEVAVRVLGVNGNQVRLGIDAPRTVPVHRLEVFERIQREEQATRSESEGRSLGYGDQAEEGRFPSLAA